VSAAATGHLLRRIVLILIIDKPVALGCCYKFSLWHHKESFGVLARPGDHAGPVSAPEIERPLATERAPRPRALEHLTPNWFASVMGTGIVATAAGSLPVQVYGLRTFATIVWLVASVALVVLLVAFAGHWRRYPANARRYAGHPVMAHFYGALPMALLTVGAGCLVFGGPVIGQHASVVVDVVLWSAGTVIGIGTALWVPYSMITRPLPEGAARVALPAWLMPLVPPMVSATTGAMLLPHLPAGEVRLTMLLGCYGLFGLSLLVGMLTISMIWSRLVHSGLPGIPAVPTVWITLGMIGQSITAANLLGAGAASAIGAPYAAGLRVFGLVYGLVMGGFGALMFVLAIAVTVHAARRSLSFTMAWWSFTFPVGTCVTAASAMSVTTGSVVMHWLAPVLYLTLVGAWATVATRTLRGVRSGAVFAAP
jgi:C4-dicarboxylate transporter/malic acid transport protein